MPPSSKSEAFQLGYVAGLINGAQATDCPINHNELDRRMDWMNGFGAARIERPPAKGKVASVNRTGFVGGPNS